MATIFVNPAQFNDPADLERYPRSESDDARKLEDAGCDLLWAPPVDEVYPEGSGFWTKGERTASFLFATDAGRPAIALTLRNGPHQNVVTVQAGALARPETLQPDETRTLTIPVDPDGLVTIRVTTSRGFRPADVSGSRDRRNLGVWVEIK